MEQQRFWEPVRSRVASTIVTLLRFNHEITLRSHLRRKLDFDSTELALRLFGRRVITKAIAQTMVVHQLRDPGLHLFGAGLDHLSACGLGVLVDISRRLEHPANYLTVPSIPASPI